MTGSHMVMSISQPSTFKVTLKTKKKKHIKFDVCRLNAKSEATVWIRLPHMAANGADVFPRFNLVISCHHYTQHCGRRVDIELTFKYL